jgi:hypothetical protein
MATVRISDTLIGRVETKIHRIFDKRLKDLDSNVGSDSEMLELFNAWFAPYETAINTIPKEFFMCRDTCTVEVDGWRVGEVKLPQGMPMPIRNIDTHRFTFMASNWTPRLRVNDVPENSKFVEKAKEFKERRGEVVRERDNMIHSVGTLLRSHATLSPALKKWPPLWDLLDEEYQERHKKVVVREKKTTEKNEALADIDFDSMTGVVVSSKLMGS